MRDHSFNQYAHPLSSGRLAMAAKPAIQFTRGREW